MNNIQVGYSSWSWIKESSLAGSGKIVFFCFVLFNGKKNLMKFLKIDLPEFYEASLISQKFKEKRPSEATHFYTRAFSF
jgi:hypothetical protein